MKNKYKSFLRQRIEIRCYNTIRSYGTFARRAIGSEHIVEMDFNPSKYNDDKKKNHRFDQY